MGRTTAAAAMALALLLAGCDDVVAGSAGMAVLPTPTSASMPAPSVESVRRSVVKLQAPASSCGTLLGGTGFVVAPHKVLTAAHVVAGSDSVTVGEEHLAGQVVSYDWSADVAIIDVPQLSAPALDLAPLPVPVGTEATALGYPDGGAFTAVAASVRGLVDLTGPDIYHLTKVTRAVYVVSIEGGLPAGASGGPLVDENGLVLGVMFGDDVRNPDTGFALTSVELARQTSGLQRTGPVWTGDCVS
jgi:S1-C subfamily serine protease